MAIYVRRMKKLMYMFYKKQLQEIMALTNRTGELSGRVKQLEAENESLKFLLQTKNSVDNMGQVRCVIRLTLTSLVL
jgi:hypothetical protein